MLDTPPVDDGQAIDAGSPLALLRWARGRVDDTPGWTIRTSDGLDHKGAIEQVSDTLVLLSMPSTGERRQYTALTLSQIVSVTFSR